MTATAGPAGTTPKVFVLLETVVLGTFPGAAAVLGAPLPDVFPPVGPPQLARPNANNAIEKIIDVVFFTPLA